MPSKERYRRDIEYYKNWRKTHRPEQREYARGYRRKHVLRTTDKLFFGVNKRSQPRCCEICGQNHHRLLYHHWDDKNPSKGIWISYWPHQLCELIDKGIIPLATCSQIPLAKKYLQLKEKINAEYALSGIK